MSVKKQSDEIERGMNLAQSKHDRNKDRVDKINNTIVNAKAGIEHLCDKLSEIKLENGEPNIKVTNETMVDALV